MSKSRVPAWFWTLIEKSRPSLKRLDDWLVAANRERIIDFARAYRDAAEEICDFSDGPTIDGTAMSEDDTEDFCNWVVTQGKATWQKARPPAALTRLVRRYNKDEGAWDVDFRDPERAARDWTPRTLAFVVFSERFDDELSDYLSHDEGYERGA